MKHILVATDFSPEAHHAFQVAVRLAQHTGGHVTLLHVLEAADGAAGGFGSAAAPASSHSIDQIFTIKLMEASKRRLLALKYEAVELAANVPVQDVVELARAGDGILAAIHRHDIDLVVMGARGHGAVAHFFVSSTTERLIRLAPCPVLTVKQAQANFAVRNVVFPSDFSAEAVGALPGLHQVKAFFPDAQLHLLHVAAGPDGHQAQQQMHAFAQEHNLGPCVLAEVEAADPSTGIEDYARRVAADLVVIPSQLHSGLSHFLRNSIAETVAANAFPPVLTYHFSTGTPPRRPPRRGPKAAAAAPGNRPGAVA